MFIALGIGLVVFGAWVSTRFATAVLNFRFPPLGTFITVQGSRLHVLDLPARDADNPAIVLVHGASSNLRDPLIALGHQLNSRYRVVLIDRPGHGHSRRSQRKQADPRVQASMIAEVLDRLGLPRAVLVGHSWGGAVSAAFGYQHPEKTAALVFLTPATHPWPGGIDWHYRIGSMPILGRIFAELLAFPLGITLVPCALRSIFRPAAPPEHYRAAVGAAMVLRPESFVANCRDIADLFANVLAMQERYCEIKAPVEIITGETDAIVAPAIHSYGLVRDIPDARLTVLPHVGHMPQWTRRDDVLNVIERAVDRSRSGNACREAAE